MVRIRFGLVLFLMVQFTMVIRWFIFFSYKITWILMVYYFEIQELKGHYIRSIRFYLGLNNYEFQNCEWVDEGKSL